MRFLPANQDWYVEVPIKYGQEFTEPKTDLSVTVNINGTSTTSTVAKGCYSSIPVKIPATDVPVEQIGYASVAVTGLTAL